MQHRPHRRTDGILCAVLIAATAASHSALAADRRPGAGVDPAVVGLVRSLQAAARKKDAAGLRKLMADELVGSVCMEGRMRSGRQSADAFIKNVFFNDRPETPNPLRTPGDLGANILYVRPGPGGERIVRVKYSKPFSMPGGMGSVQTKQAVWQITDLHVKQVGGRLLLTGVTFVPKDFYEQVGKKLMDMVTGGQIKKTEDVIPAYNRLFTVFVAKWTAAKPPAPRVRVVEEANPPVRRLPAREVTRQIRRHRVRADDLVRRQHPKMHDKLVRESLRRFRGRELFVRVYQRRFVMPVLRHRFRVTIRLFITFGDDGRERQYIMPVMRLADPAPPKPQPPKPEKKIDLPPPQWAPKAAIVLTNLAKLRERHPTNHETIRKYISSYGPVIDIAGQRVAANDWRAIDQLVESRFDRKKYDCLFIVGGPEVVPFGEYSNPLPAEDDEDRTIYSDDPYADFDHDKENDWDVMVVRLPDDRGIFEDTNSIVHRPVPPDGSLEFRRFVCYGNAEWPISHDMAKLGDPSDPKLMLSKPATHETFSADFFRNANLFTNLHGSDDYGQVYAGEETGTKDVTCVAAMTVDHAVAPGAVILSTACYGASILGKTSDTSIALRFLRNGARAFMGNTRIGYISSSLDRTIGLWAKLLKGHLDKGEVVQRAFMLAKRDFAKHAGEDGYQFKMCHQMVYYGLPPVRYKKSVPVADEPKTPPAPPSESADRLIARYQKQIEQSGPSVALLCALADAYTRKYVEMSRSIERWVLLALKTALDARRLDKAHPLPHVAMARAFQAQGKRAEALERVRRALQLDPDHADAKRLLAQLTGKPPTKPPVYPPVQPPKPPVYPPVPPVQPPKPPVYPPVPPVQPPKPPVSPPVPPVQPPKPPVYPPVPPVKPPVSGVRTLKLSHGRVYVGMVVNGAPHGRGVCTWPSGSKYEGQWVNGKRTGRGTSTTSRGSTYVGQWLDGKRHGQGTYTSYKGDKYVGQWANDKRHGQGVNTGSDGSKYEGQYHNDKRHGYAHYTSSQGVKYMGFWRDGAMTGPGKCAWKKGNQYVGAIQDSHLIGGVLWWNSGRVTWSRCDASGKKWSHGPVRLMHPVAFNNGRWNDLTRTCAAGPVVSFFVDNKYRGTAEVTLWASYAFPQDFSLRPHAAPGLPGRRKDNQAARAKADLVRFVQASPGAPHSRGLAARLRADGVPLQLAQALGGRYVYRLHVTVDDHGYFANYIIATITPADRAFAKAKIDVLAGETSRARAGAVVAQPER